MSEARQGTPAESRLARMAERLVTQRACLEWAIREIGSVPGPLLEIGLGKGRTFDHLRRLAPDREIFCLDREVHATPDCIPAEEFLMLGDFHDTLPRAVSELSGMVALVHADIGSDDRARDARLAADIAPAIAAMLRTGGLLLGDRAMENEAWNRLALPAGVGQWEYFLYRRA